MRPDHSMGNYQPLEKRQSLALENLSGLDFDLLRESQYVIVGICIILSLFCWLVSYRNREQRIFRAASRTFLFIMLGGAQLSWLGLLATSLLDYIPSLFTCYIIFTFESVGYAIVFGCVAVKTARLVQFMKSQHSLPKLNDFSLLRLLYFYICLWVLVCLGSYGVNLVQPVKLVVYERFIENAGSPREFFHQCEFGTLLYLKLVLQFISAMVGVYLGWMTSDIPAPFGEGIWLYRTNLNYLGAVVATIISVFCYPRPSLLARLLMQYSGVIGTQLVTILLLIMPKLLAPKDPIKEKVQRASTVSQITISTPEPILYIESRPIGHEKESQ